MSIRLPPNRAATITSYSAAIDDDRSWLVPACAIAVVALGSALQVNDGTLDPGAIGYLTAAFALLLAALVARRSPGLAWLDLPLMSVLCGVGLIIQIAELNGTAPAFGLYFAPSVKATFSCGVGALGLIGAGLVYAPAGRRRWMLVGALVAVHLALGVIIIRHSQASAFIDVDVFLRESIAALRKGINPYAITFPNIYHDEGFYGPGTTVNGRLQFGFPYFPLTLLLALPGEIIAGDHRYAALVAMEAAAVLMVGARRNGFGPLAAVLYLTTPRVFFVLQQSWTEPFIVLGLVAVVFAACRNHRIMPWLFGAFIAVKQYLVLGLPAAVLLVPVGDRRALFRLVGKGAIVGAVTTLPFFLWNPSAFVTSVVTLQFRQPFRTDSLSYLAWWASNGHAQPSAAIAFLVAAVIAAIAVWALPRTPAAFAGALAAIFLGFFAFNKQAFCNYYFFVVGALCASIATGYRARADAPELGTLPSAPATTLRPRSAADWLAAGLLAAVCLIPVLWPGDVSFINDEPQLIAAAAQANAAGQLAEHGLLGTFGVVYGPFPTWVYQALIAVSKDLVVVASLHTILVVGATAFALWWLSRSLGLWVWFAPVPLLSPYFWFYGRVLWDNPFLIPLGALAIAGYAAHLTTDSKAGLRVAVAAMATMPLVHLMSVAFVLPLALHMLVVRWRWLWALRASVTTLVASVSIAAWPYWHYLFTSPTPASGDTSSISGFIFPLLGGRVLSARELQYFYGAGPVAGGALQAAASISWLAYALVWAGIAVAGWAVVVAARSRRWTPREQLSAIVLAMLACQVGLDGFSGKYQHPQYYNGTWIMFVLLAWLAIDWLAARRSAVRFCAPTVAGLLASSLLVAVGTLAIWLHQHGGTRAVYGPTLANQQQVARDLTAYSSTSHVSADVFPYTLYPQALAILRQLNAKRYETGSPADLEIRYMSVNPLSGRIGIVRR